MQTGESNQWINHLRITATFAVIFLHVCSPILYLFGKISGENWWTGNIYDSFVRFCVPIFLMISGTFILPKKYTLKDYFQKRFSRIIYPFVFWSLVYTVFNYFYFEPQKWNTVEFFTKIYDDFRNGASFHLWYIYMLIGIYLILPIFSKWVQNATRNEIVFFLAIWFLVLFWDLPFLKEHSTKIDLRHFSGYIGYPILGYFLAHRLKPNVTPWIAVLLFVAGVFVTAASTFQETLEDFNFDGIFYRYLTPNVVIASVGIFLASRTMRFFTKPIPKFLVPVGKYSYGIYLSHLLVLMFFEKFGLDWQIANPLISIPLISILCLMASLILTIILNKIPFGKHISG